MTEIPTSSRSVDVCSKDTIGVASTEVNKENGQEVTQADAEGHEEWFHFTFTWTGKTFTLDIAGSDRVDDLKAMLQSLTDVPPERQKILGLVKGKQPPDQERV